MKIRFYFSVLGILFLWAAILRQEWALFLDPVSAGFVLMVSGLILLSRYEFGEIREFLTIVIKSPLDAPSAHRTDLFLKHCQQSLLVAGGCGFVMGIIMVLGRLSDPQAIGPALAVALLSLFYSLCLLGLFVIPARISMECTLLADEFFEEEDVTNSSP